MEYKTWFESYKRNWEIDLDESLLLINQNTIERNPEKYESFLKMLQKTKLMWTIMRWPNIEKRHQLLKYIYYRMRYEDDIRDNDTPLKLSLQTKEQIMQTHINWWYNENNLSFHFKNKVFWLAKELWIEHIVVDWIANIRASMQRDWKRAIHYQKKINEWRDPRDALQKVSKENITKNFYMCDIKWTVFPTQRLFWILWDTNKNVDLIKIWTSSRIIYTIRDLLTEPKDWLLHIPVEDLESYGVTKKHWEQLLEAQRFEDLPGNIIKRMKDEAQQALTDLHAYQKSIKNTTFIFEWKKAWVPTNKLQNRFNNKLLKELILPKWYHNEILKWVDIAEKL